MTGLSKKIMEEKKYLEFLKSAPNNHFSEDFLSFLRDNNEVVYDGTDWLIIKNKKYWTKNNNWLTAFYINWSDENVKNQSNNSAGVSSLEGLPLEYWSYEWLIKAPSKRTVKLFHVHLIEKNNDR